MAKQKEMKLEDLAPDFNWGGGKPIYWGKKKKKKVLKKDLTDSPKHVIIRYKQNGGNTKCYSAERRN